MFSLYTVGVQSGNDKKLVNQDLNVFPTNIASMGANYDAEKVYTYDYRPFDRQYVYYDDNLIDRSRIKVMQHMISDSNIAMISAKTNRQISLGYFFITASLVDRHILDTAGDSTYAFPLYQYNGEYGTRTVNIKDDVATKLLASIGIQYSDDMALQLFDYIYAVLYSPKYREKYKEFLKIDFPRLPYPTDQDTFWKLVEIGGKLRECHLMHTEFDTAAYNFVGDGTNEVVKPEYKNGRVYISKTQYFDNVPQAQWEQYIGGYQPLQKWLKDRKKTTLSAEDIEHYKKIIAALRLTEELMAEIDQVVEF